MIDKNRSDDLMTNPLTKHTKQDDPLDLDFSPDINA
jgi:hypothetical protein